MPTTSRSPILTVAVAAYDLESFVGRCLRSLADPAGPLALGDVEVLVVDDGSRDRTAEVADAFAASFPMIRVLRKENGGQGSALNAALAQASGLYFTAIDADDEALPDGLRRAAGLLRALEDEGAGVDLLVTDRAYRYDRTGRTRRMRFGNALPADRTVGWEEMAPLGPFQSFALNSLVFRRSLLTGCGLRLPERTQYSDVIYFSAPLAHVRTLRYLPVPIGLYHKGRPGQATSLESSVAHVDDHVRITRLLAPIAAAAGAEAAPSLARHLRDFFGLMLAGSLGLLSMSDHVDRDRKKHDLVRWIRRNHPDLHRAVRFRLLVLGARIPGAAGSALARLSFRAKLAAHIVD